MGASVFHARGRETKVVADAFLITISSSEQNFRNNIQTRLRVRVRHLCAPITLTRVDTLQARSTDGTGREGDLT